MKKLLIILLFLISKPLSAKDYVSLADKVLPSVVSITSSVEGKEVVGSGFIIDETGLIVTNAHVINNASKIDVFINNTQKLNASVKGVDKILDIALIKIEPFELLTPTEFDNSSNTKVGQKVMVVGNPFGLGNSVSVGIISAKSRDINSSPYDDYIQTDATINMGNSGGPLFNTEGKVIGMITSMFSETVKNSGIGFALPSKQIKWVVDELKKNGKITRGWIGITISPEIKITQIIKDSPADVSGLSVGDVILKINDKKVYFPKDLSFAIAKTKIGQEIKITTNKGAFKIKVLQKKALKPQESKIKTCFALDMELSEKKLEIINIKNNSDAFIKGLKQGDIIKSLDNNDMLTCQDLSNYLLELNRLQKNSVMAQVVTKDENTHFVELKI